MSDTALLTRSALNFCSSVHTVSFNVFFLNLITLPLQRNPIDRGGPFGGGDFGAGVDVTGELGIAVAGEFLGEWFGQHKDEVDVAAAEAGDE